MEKISIIIPVLNEASKIKETLASVQNATEVEVIIVDGGSEDETVVLARDCFGVQVLSSPPGRACQMNAGATSAAGDILLFLHADTRLPPGFDTLVRQVLTEEKPDKNYHNPNPIAGAFELGIDAEVPYLRLIEKMVNWRSRFFSLPYGDQAIFLRADVFWKIGGFPDLPIMEDFELMRSLRQLGRIEIVPVPVMTSGRRWQKLGVVKTTLINQLVIVAYLLKVSPARIACWYRLDQSTQASPSSEN